MERRAIGDPRLKGVGLVVQGRRLRAKHDKGDVTTFKMLNIWVTPRPSR